MIPAIGSLWYVPHSSHSLQQWRVAEPCGDGFTLELVRLDERYPDRWHKIGDRMTVDLGWFERRAKQVPKTDADWVAKMVAKVEFV